ncbi:MAG: hypothetical protein ACLR06_16690 [Christensenellaceae bacterium]
MTYKFFMEEYIIMATKKTTTTTARKSTGKGWLIRACSYFALIIAAFMFLFGGIFRARYSLFST